MFRHGGRAVTASTKEHTNLLAQELQTYSVIRPCKPSYHPSMLLNYIPLLNPYVWTVGILHRRTIQDDAGVLFSQSTGKTVEELTPGVQLK